MADEVAVGVEEAARRLGLSERTAWDLIATRSLRSFKVGTRRLVAVSELERFVERQTSIQNARPIPPNPPPNPHRKTPDNTR